MAIDNQPSVSAPSGASVRAQLEAKIDPLGFVPAFAGAGSRATGRPRELASATARFARTSVEVPVAALFVAAGKTPNDPIKLPARDHRFADQAWSGNPGFYALRQYYMAACRYGDDLVKAGRGGGVQDGKVQFINDIVQAAIAPTNSALTNPDVMITALRTGGISLLRGAKFALDDVRHRGGRPLKVDRKDFELGKDLAATPGKVVFRNELIELIQYSPQTPEVHEIPLLASPAWINKYYVFDLSPGRSFFEWAIQHERTMFSISYRNPDDSMRDITMDDYLELGPLAAIDAVKDITGSDTVDIASVCLGGAMAAITAAYLSDQPETIGSIAFLNTMLDYSEPGALGCMVDPPSLERLDAKMAKKGYLDGGEMSLTFDLLRPNDLIFNYVVSRWLKGHKPPPFDILAWNDDSTRMPARMHSDYLRTLYRDNELARGEFTIKGKKLDLRNVTQDAYVIGAINDHIVPWTTSYKAVHDFGGHVRYVLSSGGHIAGIVNPPTSKGWYEAVEPNEDGTTDYPQDPQEWAASSIRHTGSWWQDWAAWSSARAGKMVKPPKMGNRRYKVLGDAPGTYVFQSNKDS